MGIFTAESQMIRKNLRASALKANPIGYNKELFDNYIPNTSYYLPKEYRDQLYAAGQGIDPDNYIDQIYEKFLVDLSYNSSRLEGNTYSHEHTKELVLDKNAASKASDVSSIMIVNHQEAIEFLAKRCQKYIPSPSVIYTTHYLLSEALVEPEDSGRIRSNLVMISGSRYLPSEDFTFLEKQLNRIYEKAMEIEDPFEQGLFLLIHIGYLQAFIDVNKRTSRLASNIPLLKNHLAPLTFQGVDFFDYIDAITAVYELNRVELMADLYLHSYLLSAKEFLNS